MDKQELLKIAGGVACAGSFAYMYYLDSQNSSSKSPDVIALTRQAADGVFNFLIDWKKELMLGDVIVFNAINLYLAAEIVPILSSIGGFWLHSLGLVDEQPQRVSREWRGSVTPRFQINRCSSC